MDKKDYLLGKIEELQDLYGDVLNALNDLAYDFKRLGDADTEASMHAYVIGHIEGWASDEKSYDMTTIYDLRRRVHDLVKESDDD